jgi:hypothetical protein
MMGVTFCCFSLLDKSKPWISSTQGEGITQKREHQQLRFLVEGSAPSQAWIVCSAQMQEEEDW